MLAIVVVTVKNLCKAVPYSKCVTVVFSTFLPFAHQTLPPYAGCSEIVCGDSEINK
jgi:hypothetical protein